ncbi:hypothetical protein BD309DRAFT_155309 [Dichomitus squalens]|nr:hypothetical protein BD309DRAFT_155309 [Dichomitus squalens]
MDALLHMFSQRDSSDVTIAAAYTLSTGKRPALRYDRNVYQYAQRLDDLSYSLVLKILHGNGIREVLYARILYVRKCPFGPDTLTRIRSPIVTFTLELLIPSLLTLLTLLIHRVRAARAAQRDRALERIVHKFLSWTWTGTSHKKHEPLLVPIDVSNVEGSPGLEQGPDAPLTSRQLSTLA